MFTVLLYYKYVPVLFPEEVRDAQWVLCHALGLKGRIIVSSEGINGTVAGTRDNVLRYIAATEEYYEFSGIEWKFSEVDRQVFPKLSVKVRNEIVTLGVKQKRVADVDIDEKAKYIEPEDLRELYESEEDFLILDARNLYEAEIGKFKGAMLAPIDNFRDFPEFVKQIEDYKQKKVVMYCTGGVRCEKASALLREEGFEDVRQLHGGIHVYGERAGGKYFEGECFVFDDRLHVQVNSENPTVLTRCRYCDVPVTRLIDCSYMHCGTLFNCCEECQELTAGVCGDRCGSLMSS